MADSNFSKVDEYGFLRPDNFDYKTYEIFISSYLKILANRRKQWETYLKKNDLTKLDSKLKRYIRKGIPKPYRGYVWMKSSKAFQAQQKSPDLYDKLLKEQYDIEIVETIKIDLPRTFPDNIHFEKIKLPLFNVLVAYAAYNKNVGYCQGLNYIAGLILIATDNEEWTFWLLKELLENIVPNHHCKTMSGLITDIDVLVELIKIKVPEVHYHIENLGLPWAVIATKWFICIFAEVFPIETVLRIWDCIFLEGNKILFRVCITLVMLHKNEILQTNDMSELAELFREIVQGKIAVNCHEFIKNIFKIPGTIKRRDIERLRDEINKKKLLTKKRI